MHECDFSVIIFNTQVYQYFPLQSDISGSILTLRGPFYQHGLTLIPAWISNHIPSKVWDEIAYPFPNFNGRTLDVWELISNFTLCNGCNHLSMLGLKLIHVNIRGPRSEVIGVSVYASYFTGWAYLKINLTRNMLFHYKDKVVYIFMGPGLWGIHILLKQGLYVALNCFFSWVLRSTRKE